MNIEFLLTSATATIDVAALPHIRAVAFSVLKYLGIAVHGSPRRSWGIHR